MTQRGNHRERVFFRRGDQDAYLRLLDAYSTQHFIEIVAYCLMPNHVHLVVVPRSTDGLHRALKAVHSQYAQRVNRMRKLKGHLWQGRYFSSPLDADYFLNAVRYVELNPVRAGMVAVAEDYAWSSAAARCGLRIDPVIDRVPKSGLLAGVTHWSRWLGDGVAHETIETLRRHAMQNLPCGSVEFIASLERLAGRPLEFRPRGGQTGPRIATN